MGLAVISAAGVELLRSSMTWSLLLSFFRVFGELAPVESSLWSTILENVFLKKSPERDNFSFAKEEDTSSSFTLVFALLLVLLVGLLGDRGDFGCVLSFLLRVGLVGGSVRGLGLVMVGYRLIPVSASIFASALSYNTKVQDRGMIITSN